MKCPMMSEVITSGYGDRRFVAGDCLEEECAWWVLGGRECSVKIIALNLQESASQLQNIADGLRR